jgi:hypothetical protein
MDKTGAHDLTKGIATHAATPALAGTILQEMKNIDTAIQQFAASLSGSGIRSFGQYWINVKSWVYD